MEALAILAIPFVLFTFREIYITKRKRRTDGQNGGCWVFFF